MLSEILTMATESEVSLPYDKVMLAHHIIRHFTPHTARCLVGESQALEVLLQAMSVEGAFHGLQSPQDRSLKQV